jgi:DNA-binding MarR family transcriptional regulator
VDWIDELEDAWAREYPGLETAPLPPLVRLARLSLLIEEFQRAVVEPFELSPGDYGVLAALRRAGAPYALSPGQLTSNLRRSTGGMTKILKRLEERGYVARTPDPEDGRGSRVGLTRRGRSVQDRIFQAFLVASDDLLSPIGPGRLAAADRSLRVLLEAFELGETA